MKNIQIFAILILFLNFCSDSKMQMAENVIQKIESFQKQENRLPLSLSEIGIEEKESGPIYYLKKNNSEYIVWYGLSTGRSKVYDSKSKNWN